MQSNKDKEALIRAAERFGCTGLIDGEARNQFTNKWFSAEECSKEDGPFYCDVCYSDAVVRKCSVERKDHFAHKARLSPFASEEESELHYLCKTELCRYLRSQFPEGNWETERPIPANKNHNVPELVPDISGRICDSRIVIEVQKSSLGIEKIIQRTKDYSRRNIAILWIVPLYEDFGNKLFRPRQFEKFFHGLYYGKTFYWWEELKHLLRPVHYGIAERWIPESGFYDENATYQSFGGFYKNYKVIKRPIFGKLLDISIDFKRHQRGEYRLENFKKNLPRSIIFKDNQSVWWKEQDDLIHDNLLNSADFYDDVIVEATINSRLVTAYLANNFMFTIPMFKIEQNHGIRGKNLVDGWKISEDKKSIDWPDLGISIDIEDLVLARNQLVSADRRKNCLASGTLNA